MSSSVPPSALALSRLSVACRIFRITLGLGFGGDASDIMTVGSCSCSVPAIEELREAPWTNSVLGSGGSAARGGVGSGLISNAFDAGSGALRGEYCKRGA